MPWKSAAQRRWGNSPSGHEALGDKGVEEWNKASKGEHPPERVKKMAYGGETNAKHETVKSMENNPSAGFADGGEMSEPGLQDATVSDFAPLIAAMLTGGASEAPDAAEASLEIKGAPDMIEQLAQKAVTPSQDAADQFAPDLRKMWGNVAQAQSGTSPEAVGAYALPETFQPAKNMFAKGGEVQEPFNGLKMDDGGDVSAALQQLISPLKPLAAPAQMAQGLASNPSVQGAVGGIMNSMTPGANPMPQGATPTAMTQPAPDPAFMQQLQNGTTGMQPPAQAPAPVAANPVMQTSQAAQNLPPTNPGIYNGISAEDRAALMQKLIAQKSSPGMLAASGAAGLGDAITSAFGKSPTNAQGNLRAAQNQNIEQRAGIIDTERQQKMQDVAANMMVMKSDPNSSMSAMARQMYKQMTGKTPPSGISAAQIETLNPLIEKTIETTAQTAIAKGEAGVKAATAQYGEGFGQMIKDFLGLKGTETGEAGLQAAQNEAFPGTATPAAGNSMAGWSVKR